MEISETEQEKNLENCRFFQVVHYLIVNYIYFWNRMKQTIRLTEAELTNMIRECINEAISDQGTDEGFGSQLWAGAKSMFGKGAGSKNTNNNRTNGGLNLKKRWNAAKTGFEQQGNVDKIDQVIAFLQPLVDSGKIDPNQTVAQLLSKPGGTNKFAKDNLGQMRARANSIASKAQNDIYRKK